MIFLACAPKSNSATLALAAAHSAVRENLQSVPLHLRDSHTKLNRAMGHGAEYIYSHECPENISGQDYMEKPVQLYKPKLSGSEKQIAERLANYKELKKLIRQKKAKR